MKPFLHSWNFHNWYNKIFCVPLCTAMEGSNVLNKLHFCPAAVTWIYYITDFNIYLYYLPLMKISLAIPFVLCLSWYFLYYFFTLDGFLNILMYLSIFARLSRKTCWSLEIHLFKIMHWNYFKISWQTLDKVLKG